MPMSLRRYFVFVVPAVVVWYVLVESNGRPPEAVSAFLGLVGGVVIGVLGLRFAWTPT